MSETTDKILQSIITEHGIKVSGNGIICENTKKMVELLDKIQKFLYFMEKRQQEMFEFIKNNKV